MTEETVKRMHDTEDHGHIIQYQIQLTLACTEQA